MCTFSFETRPPLELMGHTEFSLHRPAVASVTSFHFPTLSSIALSLRISAAGISGASRSADVRMMAPPHNP